MAIGAMVGLLVGGAVGIVVGMVVAVEREQGPTPTIPTARQRRAWKRERLDITPAIRSRR